MARRKAKWRREENRGKERAWRKERKERKEERRGEGERGGEGIGKETNSESYSDPVYSGSSRRSA